MADAKKVSEKTEADFKTAGKKVGLDGSAIGDLLSKFGPLLLQMLIDLLSKKQQMTAKGVAAHADADECCADLCRALAQGVIDAHDEDKNAVRADIVRAFLALEAMEGCEA